MPDRSLVNPPIIEAVLDIDCSMPPDFDVAALEPHVRSAYSDRYPVVRPILLQQHLFTPGSGGHPVHEEQTSVQGFQLWQQDEKQLLQVRSQGFSFNRLKPYSTLAEYLPEIERAWKTFVSMTLPLQIHVIRMRYINRILLPTRGDLVNLDDYFAIGPRLPDSDSLIFTGFLDQHSAQERATGNAVTIILTAGQPTEDARVPIILDIETSRAVSVQPDDWSSILEIVESLRRLKNRVFFNSLTAKCLELFDASSQ
ncbi:MAG TPA: TIGR04255 family protein [Chloroflexota bacterium]|nr:TIGR04255 family protein [Chloroflexota bacterium]